MDRPHKGIRASRILLATVALTLGIAVCSGVVADEIIVTQSSPMTQPEQESTVVQRKTLTLRIDDVKGTYTIPYIQSKRKLHVQVVVTESPMFTADLQVLLGDKLVAQQRVTHEQPSVTFADLAPGDYVLQCREFGRDSQERCRLTYDHIGIGTVIAALGDSITEGYYGRGFKIDDLNLSADQFPAEAVSGDRRNFPQYAPTTSRHMPSVNCFESWMTSLNDRLTRSWRQPIFIANEGWGGITTGKYLTMMREDKGWKTRMHRLEPQIWLIHLGVNDERASLTAAEVRRNLGAIVDILVKEYRAKPANVFLCLPCYDYAPKAEAILRSYNVEINSLIKERGLSRGPDFFTAFSRDRHRWYGKDPVHPNKEGMVRMAKLWHEALIKQLPSGPKD